MNMSKFVFAILLVGLSSCIMAHEREKQFAELVAKLCQQQEGLRIITPDDMVRLQMFIDEQKNLSDTDALTLKIKDFISELQKEYEARIAQSSKYENSLKTAGFLGFFASMFVALICGFDLLPHVSNSSIERHLHSKDTQAYLLLLSAPVVFYMLYKAQGYQNDRIALQEIKECIDKLNQALN